MSFLFLCELQHTDKSRQQSRRDAWVHVPVHSALVTYRNCFCLSEQNEILVLSLIKDALKIMPGCQLLLPSFPLLSAF